MSVGWHAAGADHICADIFGPLPNRNSIRTVDRPSDEDIQFASGLSVRHDCVSQRFLPTAEEVQSGAAAQNEKQQYWQAFYGHHARIFPQSSIFRASFKFSSDTGTRPKVSFFLLDTLPLLWYLFMLGISAVNSVRRHSSSSAVAPL